MSRDFERRIVEITITIKDEEGKEIRKMQITESEEELGEIEAWEDVIWTMLTFMTFMPETIESFLSGEDYEPHIFCKDDDEYDDDDVEAFIEKGDDED